MNTKRIAMAAAALAALSLAGCGRDVDKPGTMGHNPGTASTVDPQWEPGGQEAAIKAGEKILRLYTSHEEWVNWWPALKPYVAESQQDYWSRSDPTNIPPLGKVTGRRTYCTKNPYVIEVALKTSEGSWGVDLGRDNIGGRWVAHDFIMPGHASAIQQCGGRDRMPADPPVEPDGDD